MSKKFKLLKGDNLITLKKIPDNSIDSIVTDPPYGLSFMSKKWDYDVPSVEFWKEIYRILKPGGHILSFGGTRTYHRMVVNIEDAGFEIRDQIQWIYGSGFPKSRNIGKDVEKVNVGGLDHLKVVGTKKGIVATNHHDLATKDKPKGFSYKTASHTLSHSEVASARTQTTGDIPVYEINNEFDGWGTALKPANEPICLARKPLSEKSVAENVIKWGTGGINVDGCRVGNETISIHNAPKGTFAGGDPDRGSDTNSYRDSQGRFPANIIFECICDEVIKGEKGEVKKRNKLNDHNENSIFGIGGKGVENYDYTDTGDIHTNPNCPCYQLDKQSGGASRFFYVAKVSKKERNLGLDDFEDKSRPGQTDKGLYSSSPYCIDCGKTINGTNNHNDCAEGLEYKSSTTITKNGHPTLKPINLMTYLCRLITPPNGVILDPFMGSGSTGISALLEGFRFVGCEMDEEYFKIAEARIENWEEYKKLLK